MAPVSDTASELSTDGGRGGLNAPRSAAGGGQVAPPVEADSHAGGLQAAPAERVSPSPAGLVGIQTSDTNELTEISFSASSHLEACRALSQSARIRKMKLVVGHHADAVRDQFAQAEIPVQCIMVTLTYAPAAEYSPRQVTEYVRRMCAWLDTRDIVFAYEWVLELQKRGAPHYHVLWWVPLGTRLPMPDRVVGRQRKALWPFGMTRIERARCGPAYITKYASKGTCGGSLPKGARLYGVGGFDTAKRKAQWRSLPAYIRNRTEEGDVVRRAKGGGWFVRQSGEYIPSAWERHVQWGTGYCRVVLKQRPATPSIDEQNLLRSPVASASLPYSLSKPPCHMSTSDREKS